MLLRARRGVFLDLTDLEKAPATVAGWKLNLSAEKKKDRKFSQFSLNFLEFNSQVAARDATGKPGEAFSMLAAGQKGREQTAR